MSVQAEITHENSMIAAIRILEIARDLPFVVECKGLFTNLNGFEPIAAFNLRSIAKGYAEAAAKEPGRDGVEYRVVLASIGEVLWCLG